MSDFKKLAQQMRSDWDRRIHHDYRFWMSDGYRSDEVMWSSGARDFEILTRGIEHTKNLSMLDFGCGVGRLLRGATDKFKKVYAIDVSAKAIEKAKEFLGARENLELIVGDGLSLQPLASSSIDLIVSFAALCSIPVDIVAGYFQEMHRVLVQNGTIRLQLYLGSPQAVSQADTLHLRCYDRGCFTEAMRLAGFKVESIKELVLPIQVSFEELGIEAVIVTLTRLDQPVAAREKISRALLPSGEPESIAEGAEVDLEYWMSINYAKDLAEQGQMEKAKQALEYAATVSKTTSLDVQDLLNSICKRVESDESKIAVAAGPTTTVVTEDPFMKNLAVIAKRFPDVATLLSQEPEDSAKITINSTAEGPVVLWDGQPLDHPSKPQSGADTWVKRSVQDERVKAASELTIFGFGAGYVFDSCQRMCAKKISVIEPRASVMRAAMRLRDLTAVLNDISSLTVGSQSIPDITDGNELLVRPQTQALSPEYCATVRANFYGARGLSTLSPSIGVLGPLQGGTLPITAYTLRALAELKQRIKEYDVSGYAPGFHLTSKYIFDQYRVNSVQSTYIEMVSYVIREAINEKPIDILICMAQAPITVSFLTEMKKKGIVTVLWFMEDYLRFTYWREFARYFDFVFTIQKGPAIEAIKAAGAGEVHYLPAACDPQVHTPLALSEEDKRRWGSPISFVGAGYHNRQQMFAALADLPFHIWGTEWPTCRPFDRMVKEEGRRLTPGEYIKIFNATDINLNLHSSSERDGVEPNGDFVNPRTFELAAAGAFQLVDERTHLPELLTPGKELITFNSMPDLKAKIEYYLKHPEERKAVVEAGRKRVLAEHTYAHRLRQMLSIIYNSKYESIKARSDASPWSKMLSRAKGDQELEQRCKTAWKRGEEATLDGLIADIVTGSGKLTETEQKLLFLYHVRKQIVRMRVEELGDKAPGNARQL